MNMDDVIATIGRKDYEIDQESTDGTLTFTELKYEHVSIDGKAYTQSFAPGDQFRRDFPFMPEK